MTKRKLGAWIEERRANPRSVGADIVNGTLVSTIRLLVPVRTHWYETIILPDFDGSWRPLSASHWYETETAARAGHAAAVRDVEKGEPT